MLNRINTRIPPKHIMIKLQRTSDEEGSFLKARKRRHVVYSGEKKVYQSRDGSHTDNLRRKTLI